MKDYTEDLLKEMFRRVGAEYSEEIISEPEWCYLYNWTEAEQNEFIDWATTYLKRKRRWPKSLSAVYIKREVLMFILHCGWRVKGETA